MLFIEKAKHNEYIVTLSDISEYGIELQKAANKRNIDVVFLTSAVQIRNTLNNYPDYFEFDEQTDTVRVAHTKDTTDLEWHFIGYLSKAVMQLG